MKKRLTALFLAMAMLVLAACGGGSGDSGSSGSGDNSTKEDVVKLKMAVLTIGDTSAGDRIAQEANKLLASDGISVEIQYIKFSTWKEQINLLATGGKGSLDLTVLWNQSLSTEVANGTIIPLDDLYEPYKDTFSELFTDAQMQAGHYDGKLYAIPTEKDLASAFGFVGRKDIMDEVGCSPADIKSLEDLEELLLKVKAAHPELYPLVPHNGPNMGLAGTWDPLGTSSHLGILADLGQESTVTNLYENEDFLKKCEIVKKWNDEGLIMPDVLSNTEMGVTLVAAGKGFGYLAPLKAGYAEQETSKVGQEMVAIELAPAIATTNTIANVMWAISSNSLHPQEAMKLLARMYTDAELSNLLINGIEGEHYIYNADKTLVDYPEGVNATTTTYLSAGWVWPNQYLTAPWVPNPTDIWTQLDEFNNTAKVSVALGFTPDLAEVTNEVTACTNVTDKYYNAITSGSVDVRETAAIVNKELEAAGLQKIIDAKQAQLDEWLKQQGK